MFIRCRSALSEPMKCLRLTESGTVQAEGLDRIPRIPSKPHISVGQWTLVPAIVRQWQRSELLCNLTTLPSTQILFSTNLIRRQPSSYDSNSTRRSSSAGFAIHDPTRTCLRSKPLATNDRVDRPPRRPSARAYRPTRRACSAG